MLLKDIPIHYTLTIAIQSVEIPYSFYNVSVNYNTIYYSIASVFYTMTIPEGNYTANTFITEFNSQFSLGGHATRLRH